MTMFGERLNLARKKAGLSLRDLSAKMDGEVSAQALSKYERGLMLPNSTTLTRLCKVLGVTQGFFFDRLNIKVLWLRWHKP